MAAIVTAAEEIIGLFSVPENYQRILLKRHTYVHPTRLPLGFSLFRKDMPASPSVGVAQPKEVQTVPSKTTSQGVVKLAWE